MIHPVRDNISNQRIDEEQQVCVCGTSSRIDCRYEFFITGYTAPAYSMRRGRDMSEEIRKKAGVKYYRPV
jgi:hypothetical protein